MDDWHVERHGPVGDPAVRRPLLFARLQHASDISQQGVIRCRGRASGDRLGKVDCARHQRHPGRSKSWKAFSSDEAFVDFRFASLDDHVHYRALPRRDQDLVACADVLCAYRFMNSIAIDARHGSARQRGKVAGRRVGAASHARIKEPSDQQEEEQHAGGVEVGMLATADRFRNADAEGKDEREGNRHIHVGAALAQYLPGRLEEHLT